MKLSEEISTLFNNRYQSLLHICHDLAEPLMAQLNTAQSSEALIILDTEFPNIQNALDHLSDESLTSLVTLQALHLLVGLERYFSIRGYWQEKLRWAEQFFDKKEVIPAHLLHVLYNVIGTAYSELQKYPEAIWFYQQAIANSGLEEDDEKLTRIYGNLGTAYWSIGQLDEAFYYMRRTLAIEQKAGHLHETALALANLSQIHLEMGDTEGSLLLSFEALKLAHALGDAVLQAQFLSLNARHMVANGLFEKAVPVYELAIKLMTDLRDELGLATTWLNYAILCHRIKHPMKAVQMASQAGMIFEKYQMQEELAQVQMLLAQLTENDLSS